MKINTKKMVGYIHIFSERNTKASRDVLDYKPNANKITTINGASQTYVGLRQEKKKQSLIRLVPYWAIAQP